MLDWVMTHVVGKDRTIHLEIEGLLNCIPKCSSGFLQKAINALFRINGYDDHCWYVLWSELTFSPPVSLQFFQAFAETADDALADLLLRAAGGFVKESDYLGLNVPWPPQPPIVHPRRRDMYFYQRFRAARKRLYDRIFDRMVQLWRDSNKRISTWFVKQLESLRRKYFPQLRSLDVLDDRPGGRLPDDPPDEPDYLSEHYFGTVQDRFCSDPVYMATTALEGTALRDIEQSLRALASMSAGVDKALRRVA